VGLNIGTIDVQGVRLNFWDLGGQQELQSLWDKYYQESHGVIYVIDSNDRDRMDESKLIFGKYARIFLYLSTYSRSRNCFPKEKICILFY